MMTNKKFHLPGLVEGLCVTLRTMLRSTRRRATATGPIADTAKSHAARVANTLARRLLDLDWDPAVNGGSAR